MYNATGPWVRDLLDASKVQTNDMEYVRGSHLVIDENGIIRFYYKLLPIIA